MGMPTTRSPHQADEHFKILLKQRSRPCLVVLDADLNVAFADRSAIALLGTRADLSQLTVTLPLSFAKTVRELIARAHHNTNGKAHDKNGSCEELIGWAEGLVLRVIPLGGARGTFYAVSIERGERREDLREAARRFSFTAREVQVVDLILRGMNAAEIADELHIAEVTVFDHFKHISQKTNARNRAEMLAKVFNWQAAFTSNYSTSRESR